MFKLFRDFNKKISNYEFKNNKFQIKIEIVLISNSK